MNNIRVLVVADASPMREDVAYTIENEEELSLAGTAASPSQVLAAIQNTQPDIVLIDEILGDGSSLSLTEDLATRYPDITVIAMTREGHMEFARKAMLAGARGFVTTPLANDELPQVLRQVHHLERSRHIQPPPERSARPPTSRGTDIAVYSPKGGVGKTTLAANLGVALAQQTGGSVLLVDGNPQFGHLGLVLNVHANYSLMDVLPQLEDLDAEMIEGMTASHTSGVQVLLGPGEIERADAYPPGSMSDLLSRLESLFDWIVVDTWPVLTDSTLDVLETAGHVFLPMLPDITCLRDTRQFLELAESLNYSLNKFDIIVNRATEGGLDREAIEEGLGRSVVMELPQDDPLITHSLNRGIPVVMSHKRSPVSKAINQLAESIATGDEEPTQSQGLRARMKSLFGTAG